MRRCFDTTHRELSSAGSEHLPYKQRVIGSNPIAPTTQDLPLSDMEFEAFGFDERVLEGLSAMGYKEATPIQEQAIPIIQQGRDLIGCAQTGTGKTAAFVLPIIDRLAKQSDTNTTSVLIIAPTRELVVQIDQQIEGFAYFVPVTSRAIYGGNDGQQWGLQRGALDSGADILVATPGRLIQFLQLNIAKLDSIKTLVLDEADRMLDMGFLPAIQQIIAALPKARQTLFFSATMPEQVRKLAKSILQAPFSVDIAVSKPAEGITQWQFQLQRPAKPAFLAAYLKQHPEHQRSIVFVKRKSDVRIVVHSLNRAGVTACGISADLEQETREQSLQDFKAGKVATLVATDILARGIDIDEVNLVVNYDVPASPESYVHRIGRTARAAATGVALMLVSADELYLLRRIERFLGAPVQILQEDWAAAYATELKEEKRAHSSRAKHLPSKRTPKRRKPQANKVKEAK